MTASRNIVLVVDEEQTILRNAKIALNGTGFRVMVAENGIAGMETYISMKDEICLIVADCDIPISDGQKMAAAIREMDPEAKILLMSCYSDSGLLAGQHDFPVIRKPFLPAELIRKINHILAAGAAA